MDNLKKNGQFSITIIKCAQTPQSIEKYKLKVLRPNLSPKSEQLSTTNPTANDGENVGKKDESLFIADWDTNYTSHYRNQFGHSSKTKLPFY